MKKLIALLLAALLCISCLPAMAELNLEGAEAKKLEEKQLSEINAQLIEKTAAAETGDKVTVTSEYVNVRVKGVDIRFDMVAAGGGYLCLTQDLFASLDTYKRFGDAAYSLRDNLVSQGVYLWIYDTFAGLENFVYFKWDADLISEVVGTLHNLSRGDQEYIVDMLGGTADMLEVHGSTTWINCGSYYLTIAGSQYIAVQLDSDSTPEDAAALLSALTITAAQ